jgi:hypothetical protein
VDDKTFQLLLRAIDEAKSDLKESIEKLEQNTFAHIELNRERIKTLENGHEDQKKFKWKFSGGMIVTTLLFNAILAWLTKGSGHN